jgi:hypothetical protein
MLQNSGKSLRYLLLFESSKEFKIGSDFPDTLYIICSYVKFIMLYRKSMQNAVLIEEKIRVNLC